MRPPIGTDKLRRESTLKVVLPSFSQKRPGPCRKLISTRMKPWVTRPTVWGLMHRCSRSLTHSSPRYLGIWRKVKNGISHGIPDVHVAIRPNSNMADYLERNALRGAEVYVHQAGMFIEQARRLSPIIQPVPPVSIAQGWVTAPHSAR